MSGTAAIRALFLDIGGVLLTNGWDHVARRRACEQLGLERDEIEARHALTFELVEEDRITLDEYLDRVVFYTPRPFGRDELRRFMLAQSRPLPGMLELVRELRERNDLRIAAISNEGRVLTLHRIREFRLDEIFDLFVSSCFVGMRKPDERMYRLALDLTHVEPAQAVYVEDRPLYAEVAAGLGIRSVRHDHLEATRVRLAELGLRTGP